MSKMTSILHTNMMILCKTGGLFQQQCCLRLHIFVKTSSDGDLIGQKHTVNFCNNTTVFIIKVAVFDWTVCGITVFSKLRKHHVMLILFSFKQVSLTDSSA